MKDLPFTIDAVQTGIAIAYQNKSLIADSVLPRVPVDAEKFSWEKYDLAQGITIPDTKVGRTSQPNQVSFNSTTEQARTNDYGLDCPIPESDRLNAQASGKTDPVGTATEFTTDLVLLDREVRVANTVFNGSNYAADNQQILSGSSQWSDPSSDPLKNIMEALDDVIMRPNVGVLGRRTSTILRSHPKVVKAFNGTLGDEGMVPLNFLKEYLELEEILIGEANVNIAKPGQNVQLARTWGNHAAFIYRNKLATNQRGATFGFTAQFGDKIAGFITDPDLGLRGGVRVRVGESVEEVVCAKDLGYFFQNAVAPKQ
ncbi:phage capsid protein [Entomomonas sp. E2T0]|uniref:phage capsid protein n=1 Tax=Entomomonas sp. E2T0 TaxID=2930213 RepID=UPI002228353B|nr:phage capsid protein [Entomomonas sp. E2T0]UYZ84289.1 phage capsid protein [Entomomonas sp. E2T0]